uniref:Ig-like domain-containing protein n=1 Tax=Salvator merianae TaxID=96440 RepID=A0A8D0C5H5_SALMN
MFWKSGWECGAKGSLSHSLRYFYISFVEPDQGLCHFTIVGSLDGQHFVYYGSNTKKMLPQVSWIKEVEKEYPQYWIRETQEARVAELVFRENTNTTMKRYNQTGGFHTWQGMYGCELRREGTTGGYRQYGFDGRDFIAFDMDTRTWTAAEAQAQLSKRKWDAEGAWNQRRRFYLKSVCIEWLGKEGRADYGNMETLICRADGFYPKDIEVVWTRDSEVWDQETLRGLIAPNSDGTYHIWISTKVDPKDKGRFWCRVDHASLKNPVDLAVEESYDCLPVGSDCTGIQLARRAGDRDQATILALEQRSFGPHWQAEKSNWKGIEAGLGIWDCGKR